MELIDLNNSLKILGSVEIEYEIEDDYEEGFCNGVKKSFEEIIPAILNAEPIVDAEPVVHAHWVLLDECSNAGVYCSHCHKKVYKEQYANQKLKSNYCPNCGAKMDEVVE